MKEHREPQPSVIVRRFQFNTRKQQAGETVAEYVAALRKAAEFCDYGDSLSEMLRDRLVCGITDISVQKRLLAEKDLTLDKAVSLAQSVEIAEKGAKDLKSPAENKSREAKYKYPPVCFQCSGRHLATNCRFVSEICHSCGKQGHIARVSWK